MNSDQISYLALITSIVSLIVAFITLYRDKHVVAVKAVPFEDPKGIYNLQVTVSNSGRRPISINHVLLRNQENTGNYRNFSLTGENKIDVGESRSCNISPKELLITWVNVSELRKMDVYVVDAIGKKHKAIWEGKTSNEA